MNQSTQSEIDKDQYKEIQAIIEQNPTISGFDLYYLGFMSYHAYQLSLESSFHNIRNISSLHVDGLITSEEKIQFLIKTVSKQVDLNLIKSLMTTSDFEAESKRIWEDCLVQILKLALKYEKNISLIEFFYLGKFHAICPHYNVAQLFHHISNINLLVSGDLIDEEIQLDFLLKILNKKIKTHQGKETTLDIPTDQEINGKEGQNLKNDMMIENENADSKADKTEKAL